MFFHIKMASSSDEDVYYLQEHEKIFAAIENDDLEYIKNFVAAGKKLQLGDELSWTIQDAADHVMSMEVYEYMMSVFPQIDTSTGFLARSLLRDAIYRNNMADVKKLLAQANYDKEDVARYATFLNINEKIRDVLLQHSGLTREECEARCCRSLIAFEDKSITE